MLKPYEYELDIVHSIYNIIFRCSDRGSDTLVSLANYENKIVRISTKYRVGGFQELSEFLSKSYKCLFVKICHELYDQNFRVCPYCSTQDVKFTTDDTNDFKPL